jgi:asparagine synthase (glutamine-hydrolysing)
MCGIVGAFHFSRADPVSHELLIRLRETMHHRGPDDEGIWINEDCKVGFGHRRLSIVDLSPEGRQPMTTEDGSLVITFNGEIYNHLSYRTQLEKRGHRFRSHSDTEVILHLYQEFGADCVEHLDGMFAFAIWDQISGRLLLARDRLGIKPLYYIVRSGMLLFASEIKAILAHPEVARELDREALGYYLALKTVPAPGTLFAGILKLEAGTVLIGGRDGVFRKRTYWDVVSPSSPINNAADDQVTTKTIRKLLTTAVSKRLMSDVPIGVFLSGGLDSSTIVALIATLQSQAINTFSVGIEDVPEANELEYARLVAKQFGTNHQEVMIGQKELVEYLPDLVYQQDEPLADPVCVPLFYLSRLARRSGVKVVLTGEGSDEQFLGYDSRIKFLRRYQRTWRPLLALPKGMRQRMHGLVAKLHRSTGLGRRSERILGKAARGEEVFLGSQAIDVDTMERLMAESAREAVGRASQAVSDVCRSLLVAWPSADITSRVIYIDLKIRIAELLLMRIDKVTMSVGLEARVPFLDYQLAEYLMTVPLRLKLKGWQAKYLLKRAVDDLLPPRIVKRPKKAFAAPVGAWIRNGLADFAHESIFNSGLCKLGLFRYSVVDRMLAEHLSGQENHDVRLWNLINLSAWYDRFFGRN